MPEIPDSFTQLPPLHGPGSQTPPDPSKAVGTPPPIGTGKAPSPTGMPGISPSLPTGGMTGTGLGGGLAGGKKPLGPTQPQISPEVQLDNDSLVSLRQDIEKIVKRDETEDIGSLAESLLNEGWRSNRLLNLMDSKKVDNFEDFIANVVDGTYEKELEKEQQAPIPQLGGGTPPVGGGMPQTGTSTPPPSGMLGGGLGAPTFKKPDNDTTGVNPVKANSNLGTRSGLMGKKVILKDGTMVVKEATNASDIIEAMSSNRRKVEALIDKYKETLIKQAGLKALKKEGMGPMGLGMGGMDLGIGDAGSDDLSGIIQKLKDALKDAMQSLVGYLEKGKGLKKDEDLSSEDADKIELEEDKADKTLGKAKGLLAGPPKKEEGEEDKKPPFEKEAAAGDKKPEKSDEAMKVQMGEKGPEKKKSAKDEDDDEKKKEEKEEKKEEKEEKKEDKEEKKASDIIEQIQNRLAEMKKEANLYPFKDLNKQQVDNINAQTAKSQATTINSEIKGGKHSDKESIAPKGISTESVKVTDGKNPKPVSGKVSIEVAERIRQNSVENERSKARLAVELAARQQLKGLIDNPLKEAFIKNMAEAGVDSRIAEAIVHNSLLDGYEESQKLIMKEAFDTFMEKDIDEFIKIAEAVNNYRVKESSVDSVENTEELREKTASEQPSPLRGTQASKDRKEDYKQYWQGVARERKGY